MGVGVEQCGGRCEKRCEGRCGEVCWSVGEVRGDVGDVGSSTHFPYLPPHFPHLPHISPFLLPHFSTPQHISPHLLPHFLTLSIFPPYLSQLPKLLKIFQFLHHPHSSKLSQILYTPSFFLIFHPPVLPIVTLSFTSHQNFSLFSVIAKLVQQSNTLETPGKFHKKKFKNKNIKWQHSV